MKKLFFILIFVCSATASVVYGQSNMKKAMGPGPVMDPVASATAMTENVKTHVTNLSNVQYQKLYDFNLSMAQEMVSDSASMKSHEKKKERNIKQEEMYKKVLNESQYKEWKKYLSDSKEMHDRKHKDMKDTMNHGKHDGKHTDKEKGHKH